jgi:hypothetical protein
MTAPAKGSAARGNPHHDAEGHFTDAGHEGHASHAGGHSAHPGKRKREARRRKRKAAVANAGAKRRGLKPPHPRKAAKPKAPKAAKAAKTPRAKSAPKGASKASRVPEKKPLTKAERAKAAYRPSNTQEQRYAEAQEAVLAHKLGGEQSSDNKPADVTVPTKGGGLHGVEVKTVVSAQNDKITMKKEAVDRKVAWEKEAPGRTFHTVVLDHRDRFNGGENAAFHSGHEIYYKRGVGAFRVGTMQKVKDTAELKRLMDTPFDKLPAAARGPKRD